MDLDRLRHCKCGEVWTFGFRFCSGQLLDVSVCNCMKQKLTLKAHVDNSAQVVDECFDTEFRIGPPYAWENASHFGRKCMLKVGICSHLKSVRSLSLTALISFLSTSNEPIYKVFNETACDHSRKTCDPAVSFLVLLVS